jgi:ureidoglycolate hydrolase
MRKGRVFPALFAVLLALVEGPSRAATDAAAPVPLEPIPLSVRAFKGFGQLVEVSDTTKPTSESAVHKYWAGVAKTKIHENIDFGLLLVKPRERQVAEMTRHTKSNMLLVSLREDYLLVVAPPTPSSTPRAYPDPKKVKVFMVAKEQAVIINKGVWYAMPFIESKEGLFLVAFRDGTVRSDNKEKPFKKGEVLRF